jgi:hypothetical protein
MTIYFYVEREKPYGCFSNFSAHGFMLDELYWATSEHYFQAQKFIDTPTWKRYDKLKPRKMQPIWVEIALYPSALVGNRSKMMSCGMLYYKSSEPTQTFEKFCWQLERKC